jgi:hypothetical protein
VPNKKKTFPVSTVAKIDRITSGMLQQLDLQTRAASTLLEHAPDEERSEMLARIADVRGRLVRLRAGILGPSAPAIVARTPRNSRGKP